MRTAIRPLTPIDVARFHALRLRCMLEHPEAFGTSPAAVFDHMQLMQ